MLSVRVVMCDILFYYTLDWPIGIGILITVCHQTIIALVFFGGAVPWSVVTRVCYFLLKAR